MLKVVFTSDWHLGLKTDDVDRTTEIINTGSQIIDHCSVLQKEGHKVILVIGGDIFNINTPSETHIAAFIGILGLIKKNNIKTFIMVGNHDAVADPERLSCLGFIRKAKIGYPSVNLIEDIKFMHIGDFDTGPLYFTFLPHISRALIKKKVTDGKLKEEITTQDYINNRCGIILKKVGVGSQHYVFSHLNVKGAHPGSEENLLKKSDVYLPSVFTNTPPGYIIPTIIQAHIHSHQNIGNIHIVGSPLFCSFGEKGPKYFAEISMPHSLGEQDTIDYIETNYTQFLELEIDMMGETRDFFELEKVKEFMKTITPELNPVIKLDISINPENNTYDWKAIREELGTHNAYVKPIIPRVILKRPVRSVDQKITLDPKKAVQIYLKKNLIKDKPRMKKVYALSLKYLEA